MNCRLGKGPSTSHITNVCVTLFICRVLRVVPHNGFAQMVNCRIEGGWTAWGPTGVEEIRDCEW
jgi:hypothetical protein